MGSFSQAVREQERLSLGAGVAIEKPTSFSAQVRAQEQAQAELRGAAVVQQGFDPGPLGPAGFPDFGARFDIGLSDTFEEKRDKFMKKYPEGDFIVVQPPDKGQQILFRKNPNEPFAKFDAGLLEAFEPMGDIADMSGDLPSIAIESFIVRGGGIVKKLAKIFTGEVTGRAAKEVVEELRGYQKETIKEQASRIFAQSLIGTAGAGATMFISGPLNFFRGRSNIQIVPGARAAQIAGKEIGAPPLLPSQISQSPLIRKLGQQASATTGTIKSYVQEQQKALVNTLGRLRDADRARLLRGDLLKLHEDARRQAIEGARFSDKSLGDGGRAVQQGIAEYDELARTIVNKAYQDARGETVPQITIGGRALTLNQARALSRAEQRPDHPILVFDARKESGFEGIFPDEKAAQDYIKTAPNGKFLDYGTPRQIEELNPSGPESPEYIMQSIREALERAQIMMSDRPQFDIAPALSIADDIEQKAAILGQKLSPDIQDVLERLKIFDPNEDATSMASGAIIDATERLRAIRSDLWELKTPPAGGVGEMTLPQRRAASQARRLYGAITHVLKNPTNVSSEFQAAWAKANGLAERHFDTMEKLLVIRAQRDETPTRLAARLIQPLEHDNITLLKEVLPEKRWGEFRDAAKADFIDTRNVDNLTSRLNSFDKPTLDAVFSEAEQGQLRKIGFEIDRLNQIGIERIAREQTQAAAVMNDLIARKSTAAISRIREAASPEQKATIRAALMERVARGAVKVVEGSPTVDPALLRTQIRELRETGAIRFLNLGDVQTLRAMDRYVEFVPVRADAGGSIQTASTAAGALQLKASALTTYLHNLTLGRLLTTRAFQRMMTGSGRKPAPYDSLRVIGATLADAANMLHPEKVPENQ